MIAFPINVAKKKVVKGTRVVPAVKPAKSNNGFGTFNIQQQNQHQQFEQRQLNWICFVEVCEDNNE